MKVDREDIKRQVQESTDLVALVGEQVALRARGKEFVGLCPFHNDHHPSMYVSPQKQIYKCFTCGAGGDVFSFVMNYHKLTFPESLKWLAERSGISLGAAAHGGTASSEESDRSRLVKVNAEACRYYMSQLHDVNQGRIARAYLEQRGVDASMVKKFQLGYAPDAWDALAQQVQARHWQMSDFEKGGLVSAKTSGSGYFDRMRHRLIFPICDAIGRPIAFGGRILPDGTLEDRNQAKYLNSPETPLFHKAATLYGLHLGKQAIIQSRTAVIVEGYTDVIACHQAGICNVLATLGTALTREHVHQLRHFADKVVLIFDADEAGQKAADRAVSVFMEGTLDVAIAVLPGGCDPAELLSQPDGVDQWHDAIGAARDALDYQFCRMRETFEENHTVAGRQHVTEDYLRQLAQMGIGRMKPIRRGLLLNRIAQLVHLDEHVVSQMLDRFARSGSGVRSGADSGSDSISGAGSSGAVIGRAFDAGGLAAESSPRIKALSEALIQLVGCLLVDPNLFHTQVSGGHSFEEAIIPGDFGTKQGNELYQVVYDALAMGSQPTLRDLLAEMASRERQDLANLLTEADATVQRLMEERDVSVQAIFEAAAGAILHDRAEQDYRHVRGQVLDCLADGEKSDSSLQQDHMLRQLVEDRKMHSVPWRIARS